MCSPMSASHVLHGVLYVCPSSEQFVSEASPLLMIELNEGV